MGYHPWFEPLWRRIATLAVCVIWVAFEAGRDTSSLWFWGALVLTGIAVYDFFLAGHYGKKTDQDGSS